MPSRFDRVALRLGRFMIVAISVVAPLLLAEWVARSTFAPRPPRRVYDPLAYRIPHPGLVDTFTGIENETVTVRLNELGMRGPSLAASTAPGTKTLVFLGGSTTENYGLTLEQTFPEAVGTVLSERLAVPMRILNGGASGTTSPLTLGRLQYQVVDLAPQGVVVMHAINDFLGGFEPGYRADGRHLKQPVLASRRPRSYLRAWARSLRTPTRRVWPIADESQVILAYEDFPARQAFARNLRSIVAVAQAHGVPLVLLTQPTMYEPEPTKEVQSRYVLANALWSRGVRPPDPPSLVRGMAAFNDTTREIARELGVPLVDLAALMPRSWDLFIDECHYTALGNQRLAEWLTPALEAVLQSSADDL